MNGQYRTDPRWKEFVSELAGIADAAPEEIGRDTRLIEDLGLDSVALTETAVMLITEFGAMSLSESLETLRWADVSAGGIYDEYCVPARTQQGR